MSTKVSTDLIDLSSNTGGLIWAKGTTAQQPASATAGEMRVDTTTATTLVYTGTQWKTLKETAFVVPPIPTHFLVIAGGGGGASGYAGVGSGGGGAGGLRTSYGSTSGGNSSAESTIAISLNIPYGITVGDGGIGAIVSSGAIGGTGNNSIFSTITSDGGGGGKSYLDGAAAGASGSGGSGAGGTWSSIAAGSGTSNQGKNGGTASATASTYGGGGGGGAITDGVNGSGSSGGTGGTGLSSNITGTSLFYSGGGGGGAGGTANIGNGGSGVGGNGGTSIPDNASSGIFNTGSGGGGGGGGSVGTTGIGGAGSAGVVILRYPTADLPYFTTTGTLNTPSATDTVADVAYPVTNTAYYKLDSNANDSALSGYIGQGGIFNGSSSNVNIAGSSFDYAAMTASCWFNLSSTSQNYQTIFNNYSQTSGQNRGWYIRYETGGNLRLRGYSSTNIEFDILQSTTINANTWYHLAVTISSSQIKIYQNNSLINTTSISTAIGYSGTGGFPTIGSYRYAAASYGNYFNGKIDQVRIYNTALSSSNVALLYAETSATSSTLNYPTGTGGQALYEFSGNADSTSSSAYNGTATDVLYAYNGTATDVTYGNGRFNEAANFNGSSSYIDLGNNLGLANNSFSFSCWIKNIGTGSNSWVFAAEGSGSTNQKLHIGRDNSNGKFYIDFWGNGLYSTSQVTTNSIWQNWVITFDSTTKSRKIYLNGSLDNSDTSSSNYLGTGDINIGQLPSYNQWLQGTLDQVRIFSSALAAGDVEDLYNEHFPTKFTDGSDTALMFTGGTGDITFLDTEPITVNYLVVAGGGGGGPNHGGGGGAGGLRTSYGSTSGGGGAAESSLTLSIGTIYTVTIGAGGIGGVVSSNGASGANSVFSTITSLGGGGGAQDSGAGVVGGSGGGGSRGGTAGSGTANQGYSGSTGVTYSGGGGGGAGAVGSNGNANVGGNGGAGIANSISSVSVNYAGGGGGNGYLGAGGTGGTGGGGNGGQYGGGGEYVGSNGTPNTGGGGGGNFSNSGGFQQRGMDGGSGIVIIRYPNTKTITVGAGLTATTAAVGTDSVTTFTAGTGTITFS